MTQVTDPTTLDALIELGTVFSLSPQGHTRDRCTYRDSGDYPPGYSLGHAPEVNVTVRSNAHGDMDVVDGPHIEGQGWSFFSAGYSGQYGLRADNPTMHPSEFVGGALARDMIHTGGTYVVVEIVPLFSCGEDCPCDEAGSFDWTVLRKDDVKD